VRKDHTEQLTSVKTKLKKCHSERKTQNVKHYKMSGMEKEVWRQPQTAAGTEDTICTKTEYDSNLRQSPKQNKSAKKKCF